MGGTGDGFEKGSGEFEVVEDGGRSWELDVLEFGVAEFEVLQDGLGVEEQLLRVQDVPEDGLDVAREGEEGSLQGE